MGAGESSGLRALISGLDGAGKTTLLVAAEQGQAHPTIATIGQNHATVQLGGRSVQACDVGAGGKGSMMFTATLESLPPPKALVHVIRASDPRLCSSLWELCNLVSKPDDAELPVCVVVICDDQLRWQKITQLAQRCHLPPSEFIEDPVAHAAKFRAFLQGTMDLNSPVHRLRNSEGCLQLICKLYDRTNRGAWADDICDEWLQDWRNVRSRGETSSHGFKVCPDERPPALSHRGPWGVVPIVDICKEPREALKPFLWCLDHSSDALSRNNK